MKQQWIVMKLEHYHKLWYIWNAFSFNLKLSITTPSLQSLHLIIVMERHPAKKNEMMHPSNYILHHITSVTIFKATFLNCKHKIFMISLAVWKMLSLFLFMSQKSSNYIKWSKVFWKFPHCANLLRQSLDILLVFYVYKCLVNWSASWKHRVSMLIIKKGQKCLCSAVTWR